MLAFPLSLASDDDDDSISLPTPDETRAMTEESVPAELPILTLRNTVLFPGVVMPITVGRDTSLRLVKDAYARDKRVGVVAQKDADTEEPGPDDLHRTGTVAQILKLIKMPDGSKSIVIQGKRRFEIDAFVQTTPYLKARVHALDDEVGEDDLELRARIDTMKQLAVQIVELSPHLPSEAALAIRNIESPAFLTHFIASNLQQAGIDDKQAILDAPTLTERADLVLTQLQEEIQVLEISEEIRSRVRTDVDKQQRDFLLRQQMKAIQEELGEGEEGAAELGELRARAAKAPLPPHARKTVEKEMTKLARLNPMAPDHSVTRGYIEWILDLPWETYSADHLDLREAARVLDEDHYGLEKVKRRILEYLAVLKLTGERAARTAGLDDGRPTTDDDSADNAPADVAETAPVAVPTGRSRKKVPVAITDDSESSDTTDASDSETTDDQPPTTDSPVTPRVTPAPMRAPILCLYGPPGVGKTSLGKSIARALGREFVRMSLGGVRDEAELRGHRRTYVGALPGRIIQSLKKAGTSNPVFILDEVDKLGSDYRGDPSSALLEILDPEQNSAFNDHYLELDYDLSKVLFVATANYVEQIPAPLRDRMEMIEITGYTHDEKRAIARQYLVPRQRERNGLDEAQFDLTDEALDLVIDGYTRESGVRQLEQMVGSVARGVAAKVARGDADGDTVTPDEVDDYLDSRRYYSEVAERTEVPGVATGLAWTPVGGDILFIEASVSRGSGRMILTGKLGDVMRESAQAAHSYVRAHADELGIPYDAFRYWDLHVHVPAGAIPKDGPSAGTGMLTALTSIFTQRRVRHDTAMTGEITLRGLVLPVGGVKEKVLAARRSGITRVVLPERNRTDIEDIRKDAIEGLDIHYVSRMRDVLPLTLEDTPVRDAAAFFAVTDADREAARSAPATATEIIVSAPATPDGRD